MKPLVTQIVEYCKIMGDEQRLKICRILASNMKNTITVNDITKILGISQPAVSRHLKLLVNAQILTKTKVGANVFYSLNNEKLEQYINLSLRGWNVGHIPCKYEFKCESCPNQETCI